MGKIGDSLRPKKVGILAAAGAGVLVAVLVGFAVNSSVPRSVFPSEVVHPAKSGNVIIPSNAWDSNGNASFSPKELTVVLGINNTVVWENDSPNPERVTGLHESMPGGFGTIKSLIPAGGSWAFTFTEAGVYDYISEIHPWLKGTVFVNEAQTSAVYEKVNAGPARILYGFDNDGGVIPCIVTNGDNTPTVKIYMENTMGPDAVVNFTLTANNAYVSLDSSTGFKQSSNKTITILEGTSYYAQTFYVRPFPDSAYLSLTLDATAIDPRDTKLVYSLEFDNTVFFKNFSGKYCREVSDLSR